MEKLPYIIVRTETAGVFAGFLKGFDARTKQATMINSRRIWYWAGAATLSELSQKGTIKPKECKFPMEVPLQEVMGVNEILYCSPEAQESIQSVSVWKAE